MDIIIARLRNEPALVWGIVGTLSALIMSLATGGGLTVAAIPVIIAGLARQFTVGPVTAEDSEVEAHSIGYDDGYASARAQADRAAAGKAAIKAIGFTPSGAPDNDDKVKAAFNLGAKPGAGRVPAHFLADERNAFAAGRAAFTAGVLSVRADLPAPLTPTSPPFVDPASAGYPWPTTPTTPEPALTGEAYIVDLIDQAQAAAVRCPIVVNDPLADRPSHGTI